MKRDVFFSSVPFYLCYNLFMFGRFLTYILLLSTFFLFSLPASGEEFQLEGKKNVEYTLKYPGLMQDHPLFFLKKIRDRINLFLIRDYLKKSDLILQISDKDIHSGLLFSQQGKWGLAANTVDTAERDFMKIFPLLNQSKKQGVTSGQDFILILKLSNEKHQEVIEAILKDVPQGERKRLSDTLMINKKA